MRKAFIAAIAAAHLASLQGCATSRADFYADPQAVGTWSLCRTWAEAEKSQDAQMLADVVAEASRRGLTVDSCRTRNNIVDAGAIAIIVLGAVAAVAAAGGGGGGGGASDSDWAWDQFRAQDGSMVWACRGRQSGRFSEQWRCNGKAMGDFTWPGPYL